MDLLTVDLGNSRLKACLWRGERAPAARHESASDDFAPFEAWLRESGATRAGLSSVAGDERTTALLALLARAVPEVVPAPEPLLENHCRSPERVGRDRLHAAVGAARLVGRSVLVVNAGTALTIDVVRIVGRRILFEGGAIAPGPALLARALHEGTARLPFVTPRPGAPVLGRESEEALAAGIVHGFRGAAAHLLERLAEEAGLADPAVVVSGGARPFLLEPNPFTARELVVEPELVQRGLLAALTGRGAGG